MPRRCLDAERFADGVWLVDLAPLPDGSTDVAASAAAAMGLSQQPNASFTDAVVSYLAHRQVLIVLDNCEHVAPSVAAFIDDVLDGAPSTTMVAASRVRLGVRGEQAITLDRLPNGAAHTLLVARIAEAGAGPFSDDACGELCRVLDNYPLAIELAAARTRALAPQEIVARLAAQPGLLGTPGPHRRAAVPHRHVDLATALDWSIAQLSPSARRTLDATTVFVSDFDLTDAEAVLLRDELSAADVVDDIGELVEHHLLHRDHGRARFRMLEPIRQHRRADAPASEQRRYIEHYAALAIDAAVGLRGPDEAIWWDRVHRDLPHMREAVRLAIDDGDVALLDSMMTQLAITSWLCAFTEPCEWAVEALRRLRFEPIEAPGVAAAAAAQYAHLEQMDECDALLTPLESLLDAPCIQAVVGWTRFIQAPTERHWWRRFRDAAEECGDPALLTWAKIRRGTRDGVALADRHGNPTLRVKARQHWSASLRDGRSAEASQNRNELYRIALTSNNSLTIAEGQMFMALQHCHECEPHRAGPLAVEMIERLVRTRSPFWIWYGVEVVGVMLAMVRIEPFTAEKLWASVTASGWTPFSRTARRPELPEWVAAQLSDEERRRAVAEGSVLDMDAAAREARKAAKRMAGG